MCVRLWGPCLPLLQRKCSSVSLTRLPSISPQWTCKRASVSDTELLVNVCAVTLVSSWWASETQVNWGMYSIIFSLLLLPRQVGCQRTGRAEETLSRAGRGRETFCFHAWARNPYMPPSSIEDTLWPLNGNRIQTRGNPKALYLPLSGESTGHLSEGCPKLLKYYFKEAITKSLIQIFIKRTLVEYYIFTY